MSRSLLLGFTYFLFMTVQQFLEYCAYYDAFSSWCAAGALARVKVQQKKAIHEAVIKEDWQTAHKLLSAVRQGRHLFLPDPLAPHCCVVPTFQGAQFSGFSIVFAKVS